MKELNRLINKEMSNIYLKATFGENLRSKNFDFPSLKRSSQGQLLGRTNLRRYH